jgi:hypothetical protein
MVAHHPCRIFRLRLARARGVRGVASNIERLYELESEVERKMYIHAELFLVGSSNS